MERAEVPTWSQPEVQQQQPQQNHSQPPPHTMAEDDFATFLDFENMEINFPMFDEQNSHAHPQHQNNSHQQYVAQQDPDVAMPDAVSTHMNGAQPRRQILPGDRDKQDGDFLNGNVQAAYLQNAWSAQSKQFSQQQQQLSQAAMHNNAFQLRRSVPPTPNSADAFPPAQHYLQNMPRQGHERQEQYQARLDDMVGFARKFDGHSRATDDWQNLYTPHMTPDVPAGSESAFSYVPEYTVPGTYNLSPLNSPAMGPQNNTRSGVQYSRVQPSTAGSSQAASPIDLSSFDTATETERPRKTRKKLTGSVPSTPSTRARQSSKAGASKRRNSIVSRTAASSTKDSQTDLAAMADTASQPSSGRLSIHPGLRDGSSKSISPRPLSEARMAPPPRPAPLTVEANGNSAQKHTPEGTPKGAPPATPASLMRLQPARSSAGEQLQSPGSAVQSPLSAGFETGMGFLALPEAAAPIDPAANTSKSTVIKGPAASPAIGSKTPIGSALQSPIGPNRPIQPDAKGARTSRKRGSTSSHLVSPALRPRISPSIKPLLPEGSNLSQDAHALLLASKSNYQNLLEGNAVPGVNYPSDLATNLTSKRTSHKIAEQGRRNRINMALQEMQGLLPLAMSQAAMKDIPLEGGDSSPNGADGSGGEGGNGKSGKGGTGARTPATPAQGGNSKAATVELAIQYIKTLNGIIADKELENVKLRQEMAALRVKAGIEDADKSSEGEASERKDSDEGAIASTSSSSGS